MKSSQNYPGRLLLQEVQTLFKQVSEEQSEDELHTELSH